ncbi:MAG: hypothetical protein RIB60_07920 [Phycisphaerales bacterium]
MPTCQADESIARVRVGDFAFPLGAYPVEEMEPKRGYLVEFEPADGDNDAGDWEEWPDRYVYDIVVSAERIEPLWRQLVRLLPPRVYPILDYMGRDAYREVDPYISYELVGLDRVTDALRRFRDFFFEDGLVGFGAACDDPFVYIFVDEHKILTVRVATDRREKVEALLEAFGVPEVEEPLGADSAAHEHRGILSTPPNRPDLLNQDEVLEIVREDWKLVLNIDPETNLDDEGRELGETAWRCVVRVACERHPDARYAEVLAMGSSLLEIEDTVGGAGAGLIEGDPGEWTEAVVVTADRVTTEQLAELMSKPIPGRELDPKTGDASATNAADPKVLRAGWFGPVEPSKAGPGEARS